MGNANPGDRLSRDRAAGPRTVAIETGQASIPLTTLKTGVDFDLLLEYGLPPERGFIAPSFIPETPLTFGEKSESNVDDFAEITP